MFAPRKNCPMIVRITKLMMIKLKSPTNPSPRSALRIDRITQYTSPNPPRVKSSGIKPFEIPAASPGKAAGHPSRPSGYPFPGPVVESDGNPGDGSPAPRANGGTRS